MKDLKFEEPNMEEIVLRYEKLLKEFNNVDSLEEQLQIIKEINDIRDYFFSMYWISYINYLLDVNSEYRNKEESFFAKNDPIINNLRLKYYKELLNSKYKEELKKVIGNKVFQIAESEVTLLSDDINDCLTEEKELSNKYSKLLASQKVFFDNKEMPLSMLNKYLISPHRDVRIKAQEVRKNCFLKIESQIDDYLDKLIKVRNKMARKLGFSSYTDVSYIKMKRIGYGRKDVELFRNEVVKYIVPFMQVLKEKQAKELGVDTIYYYDDEILFSDGGSSLMYNTEGIITKTLEMYKQVSPKIYKLFKKTIDEGLMDLESREGKSGGGITTYIPTEKVPIFVTNFNGTSRDIQVLTHEFGHSFQLYSSKDLMYYENWWPTFDTCEIHSKSMELLTLPYMSLLFSDSNKYKYEQLYNVFSEMCYICLIDEFQHVLYDNETLTTKERKQEFRKLEKKYIPWKNYKDNDYLERGNTYQKKSHVFVYPFYYIDYAISDTVALQFYIESLSDREEMWGKYIDFCSLGGTYSLVEILKRNGLDSPFEKDTLKKIIKKIDI